MSFKSVNTIITRVINEYERGDNLSDITNRLHLEGYRTQSGSPLHTSSISKIAIGAGCARRSYRKATKSKPTKVKLADNSFNSSVVVEILSSTSLSEAAKKEFLRFKLGL